ncbi:CinA family nicotinamide mononucleotide deamidase-related protein [Thalassotalea eurytherma]|uniref:CinA-like protein n=1 Tax=Thalassotalea eurytherma TaxID=1144278 RepID=A0ABQ6H032_9GAMM|nr:CinA family nicotinamide mononucleotide deamidase-related protein [Thalassotalea eurytherma]GLX81533.1 nicotinamide-nucleotide amidohydrolase PncC [Thalassotalea eurytherma]
MTKLNVQLLMTGNELMTGDIVDSNSAFIANEFKNIGVTITRKITVADDLAILTAEISQISQQSDLLIINGGLGPTTDDLTAQALASAANLPIEEHPNALEHLTTWCAKRNAKLSAANLKQALLPKGCDIVANSIGSAVGFSLTINNCLIICTPGVPKELKLMVRDEITPTVKNLIGDSSQIFTKRMQVFGYGESGLQQLISDKLPQWPEQLEIGFRASMPLLELKVTYSSAFPSDERDLWLAQLESLLEHHIVHHITNRPISLAEQVNQLLSSNNLTLTTAESCTGGLIASQITQVSGASQNFHAGFVTYSNDMKSKLLNVNKTTLEEYGAVSEHTVIEMLKGALAISGAELGIAVSGIAGPTGGTDDKPVGTVWIAWGNHTHLNTVECLIPGTRWYFQQAVCAITLDLIRRFILNIKDTPRYLVDRAPKHIK